MFEVARAFPDMLDGIQFENKIRAEVRQVNETVANKLDKLTHLFNHLDKRMNEFNLVIGGSQNLVKDIPRMHKHLIRVTDDIG